MIIIEIQPIVLYDVSVTITTLKAKITGLAEKDLKIIIRGEVASDR
jgi:hypothetical protein